MPSFFWWGVGGGSYTNVGVIGVAAAKRSSVEDILAIVFYSCFEDSVIYTCMFHPISLRMNCNRNTYLTFHKIMMVKYIRLSYVNIFKGGI